METLHTTQAPAAIGPYSQGKQTGNLIFLSGQLPLCPETGHMAAGIEAQTEQVCKNIAALLTVAGLDFQDVVKTTCFLDDLADFAAFNEVYARYFISRPARSCVAVKALPKDALVEIECVVERR